MKSKHKRIGKKLLSLLLIALTVFGIAIPGSFGSPVTAQAATIVGFDILTTTKYAKTYTLASSGITVPYTSPDLSRRGTVTYGASDSAYIANDTDELYIMDVGQTNGVYWAYVSYPVGSRRAYAYIPLSALTTNNGNHAKTTSTGKFYCSLREGSANNSTYYVAKNDTVILVATSGSKCQILYPVSGGKFRLAWCDASDYERYCGTIISFAPQAPANVNGANTVTQVSDLPKHGAYVRIRYSVNGRYVDIPAEGIWKDGTQLQLWNAVPGNLNQIYQLIDTGNGWQIISAQSGKVIEVRNSSHDDYAHVSQWSRHSLPCSRWNIISNDDGSVSFQNVESGKFLNVCGGGDAGNGVRLIQYWNDQSAAMRFYIETTTLNESVNSKWMQQNAYTISGYASQVQLSYYQPFIKLNGEHPTNTRGEWKSSDPSIASVDGNGLVTGWKNGKCTISVTTSDGQTVSADITVKNVVLWPCQETATNTNVYQIGTLYWYYNLNKVTGIANPYRHSTKTVNSSSGPIDGYRNGIDVSIAQGTPVIAVESGTVVETGKNQLKPDGTSAKKGFGNYIILYNEDTCRYSLYGHLRDNPGLQVGVEVSQGSTIGYVGSTGNSTGPHLHFEMWGKNSDGTKTIVDPFMTFYATNRIYKEKIKIGTAVFDATNKVINQGGYRKYKNSDYTNLLDTEKATANALLSVLNEHYSNRKW